MASRRRQADPTRPAVRRLEPAARTEAMLEATLKLLAERHFSAVTVREVALACSVTPGLIYRYFENKDHLCRAAIEQALTRLLSGYEARRPSEAEPLATIEAWLDTNAAIAPQIVWLAKIMGDYAAAAVRDPAIDALIATLYRRERQVIEEAISRGIARGVFRPVEVERTARMISLQIDGIFYAAAPRGDARVLEDLADLKAFVRDFLVV